MIKLQISKPPTPFGRHYLFFHNLRLGAIWGFSVLLKGQDAFRDRTTNSTINGHCTLPTKPHMLLVQRPDEMYNFIRWSDDSSAHHTVRIRARGSLTGDWYILSRHGAEDKRQRQQPVSLWLMSVPHTACVTLPSCDQCEAVPGSQVLPWSASCSL